MRKIFLFCWVFFSSFQTLANQAIQYNLKEIDKFGDVLNITGGRIPKEKLHKEQIWSNICFVTNNPLEEDFQKIRPGQNHLLREQLSIDFNEPQLHYSLSLIMKYYIENAHIIAKKDKDSKVRVIVHIHRMNSAKTFLTSLQSFLKENFSLPEKEYSKVFTEQSFKLMKEKYKGNVDVTFKYGYKPTALNGYEKADIVISLSPVASLKSDFAVGQIVVPNDIVPMNLDSMTIFASREYKVSNHFLEIAPKVIESQNINVIHAINNKLKSKFKIKELNLGYFPEVRLVQVDGFFKPKLLPQSFYVYPSS